MAESGGLHVTRLAEVEHLFDAGRGEVEVLCDNFFDLAVVNLAGTEGVHEHGHGLGVADGVGELHFATVGEACGHDVLGHVAGGVGCTAVDLGGVLAAERATTVTAHAAVGVDDDLTAGEAAVAVRAADNELAGRVHEVTGLLVQKLGRDDLLDELLDDFLFDLGMLEFLAVHLFVVLGGDDDSVNADRLVIFVVFDGDLGLGVRTEPLDLALFAEVLDFFHELVGEADRERHQFLCFLHGITEHHALVASTLLVVFLAFGGLGVNALGDIRRLLIHGNEYGAALVVELEVRVHVADVLDGVAGNFLEINNSLGGDFAGNDDETGIHERFAGDAALRVLGEAGVEDGVGNLVGDLVRVAFRNRFGGKKIMCHLGLL